MSLTKYTNHLPECDISFLKGAYTNIKPKCTCGLEQALKLAEEKEKLLTEYMVRYNNLEKQLHAVERFRAEDAMHALNEENTLRKQLSDLREGANQRAQRLIDQYEIEKAKFEAREREYISNYNALKEQLAEAHSAFTKECAESFDLKAELTSLREIAGKMAEAMKAVIDSHFMSDATPFIAYDKTVESLSAYTQYINQQTKTE